MIRRRAIPFRLFHTLVLGATLFLLPGSWGAEAPPPLSEDEVGYVRQLISSFPPRRPEIVEALRIRGPDDTVAYFKLHIDRVQRLGLEAFDRHWEQASVHFGVPASLRQKRYLRRILEAFLGAHDLAKLDPTTAEGLYDLMGVNVGAISEKKAVLTFFGWFNARDALFGEQALRDGMTPGADSLGEFMRFFEKVGDLVDRTMSSEATLELGRATVEPVSEYEEQKLVGFLKPPPTDPTYVAFYRQVARDMEASYAELTAGRSYRETKPPGCLENLE